MSWCIDFQWCPERFQRNHTLHLLIRKLINGKEIGIYTYRKKYYFCLNRPFVRNQYDFDHIFIARWASFLEGRIGPFASWNTLYTRDIRPFSFLQRQTSNFVGRHFLGTKFAIGSRSSPNADVALVFRACSEYMSKRWAFWVIGPAATTWRAHFWKRVRWKTPICVWPVPQFRRSLVCCFVLVYFFT